MLPRILVHVRRPQHAVNLLPGGQHDGALELGARQLRDGHQVLHRVGQQAGVVGAHADAQPHVLFCEVRALGVGVAVCERRCSDVLGAAAYC